MGCENLQVLMTHLLLINFWDVKPTYRISLTGNLLMWSDLALGPSLKVKPFSELSFWWIQFNLHHTSNVLGPVSYLMSVVAPAFS